MSDTWNQIQDFKSKQNSLREKLKRRKAEREGLLVDVLDGGGGRDSPGISKSETGSPAAVPEAAKPEPQELQQESNYDAEVETNLYVILCDIHIPAETKHLRSSVSKAMGGKALTTKTIDDLLQRIADQSIISLEKVSDEEEAAASGKFRVVGTEQSRLVAMATHIVGEEKLERMRKRKRNQAEEEEEELARARKVAKNGRGDAEAEARGKKSSDEDSLDFLLSATSAKEKEKKEQSEDILYLLSKPTAKEQSLVEKFRSAGGVQIKDFCDHITKEECNKFIKDSKPCDKVHYRKIIYKHTDETLGDCSFLNTCFHMDTCKYVHYEMDAVANTDKTVARKNVTLAQKYRVQEDTMLWPAQWVQCDLRFFDMSVLGKFTVIMADPPWDIHMELPYGTMSDDEMRKLPVPIMQDDGYIFLWVTGRAMELGRECLNLWGYERCDEIIWVKTNQLQRIIRTGRTGHWINHGKEHCIVGVKGNPQCNRGFDCDIVVAEVRATSHKPDEIYGLIERLAPGKRKIELFGRPHNSQPNWTTLGNQVDGVRLSETDVVKKFKEVYPDGNCMRPPEWWLKDQKKLQQKQKEQAEKFQS